MLSAPIKTWKGNQSSLVVGMALIKIEKLELIW